jgi:hypothetical protein
MFLSRLTTAVALALSVPSCASNHCALPENWVMATALRPSPVPYTPKPVLYAQETRPGVWMWHKATIAHEQLLKDVAAASSLNPQPLVLFDFAKDQSCRQLNATRAAISKASGCSKDDSPCVQEAPTSFNKRL